MVNSISFGSTYRAFVTQSDTRKGIYSHRELEDFCLYNQIRYKEDFSSLKTAQPQYYPSIGEKAYSFYAITAPDEFDSDIEAICKSRGIKFEKTDTKSNLSPNGIFRRIEPNKKGYTLTHVNVEKLESLLKTQSDNNFESCKSDYDEYYKSNTDFALKSGADLSAQTLYIRYESDDGTPESLRDYVRRFGKNNLNPDSIGIWQAQEGEDSTINIYFALKEMGCTKIPVYLDDNSYQNALTLGLLD